eukprot:403350946
MFPKSSVDQFYVQADPSEKSQIQNKAKILEQNLNQNQDVTTNFTIKLNDGNLNEQTRAKSQLQNPQRQSHSRNHIQQNTYSTVNKTNESIFQNHTYEKGMRKPMTSIQIRKQIFQDFQENYNTTGQQDKQYQNQQDQKPYSAQVLNGYNSASKQQKSLREVYQDSGDIANKRMLQSIEGSDNFKLTHSSSKVNNIKFKITERDQISQSEQSQSNQSKQYFNNNVGVSQSNKKISYQSNVQESLIQDAMSDRHLYDVFKSKFQQRFKKEKTKEFETKVMNHKMLLDQLESLSAIHEQCMTNIIKEQQQDEIYKSDKISLKLSEKIKDMINSTFLVELIQQINKFVTQNMGSFNKSSYYLEQNRKSQQSKKIPEDHERGLEFDFECDTYMYSIIDELKDSLNQVYKIGSSQDYVDQLERLSKIARQTVRNLVSTNRHQEAMIMELLTKQYLILSNKYMFYSNESLMQQKEKLKRESQENLEDSLFVMKKNLEEAKSKILKKKQRIKHLKNNTQILNQRIQNLTIDYDKLSDELNRLTRAQPGEDLNHLTNLGKGMDQLFEQIEEKQKKTLIQMDSMAKMMDFKTHSKNAALVKVGTQTDFEMNTDYNFLETEQDQTLKQLQAFTPYLDMSRFISTYKQLKLQRISMVDDDKSSHLIGIIQNLFREKLAIEVVKGSDSQIQPFNSFLVQFISQQCGDQPTAYRQLAKMLKQCQQFKEQGIQAQLINVLFELTRGQRNTCEEMILVKAVCESISKGDSSKESNFEIANMSLTQAFYFGTILFGLFFLKNQNKKEDRHEFLGNQTEGEYLLIQYLYHLAFIVKSSKKSLELKFEDSQNFEIYIEMRKKELFQCNFEFVGLKGIANVGSKQNSTSNTNSNISSPKKFRDRSSLVHEDTNNLFNQPHNLSRDSSTFSLRKSVPASRGTSFKLPREMIQNGLGNPNLIGLTSKQYRNDDLIKESVVENDIQFSKLQEYLEKVAIFALKKMILSSAQGPNIINNFKDTAQGGGFLRKLKNEYTQGLIDLGRDPNLQNWIEFHDKIKPGGIITYCQDHQININNASKNQIAAKNLVYLIMYSFDSLHAQKQKHFTNLLDNQKSYELKLNSLQLASANINQDQLNDISLTNYNVFYKLLTDSNPVLKLKLPLILQAYKQIITTIELKKASVKDIDQEVYRYDPTIDFSLLNRKVKFKKREWIDMEYKIASDIVIDKLRLMHKLEFKQGYSQIQRALHPQTIDEIIKNAMTTVQSPSNKKSN